MRLTGCNGIIKTQNSTVNRERSQAPDQNPWLKRQRSLCAAVSSTPDPDVLDFGTWFQWKQTLEWIQTKLVIAKSALAYSKKTYIQRSCRVVVSAADHRCKITKTPSKPASSVCEPLAPTTRYVNFSIDAAWQSSSSSSSAPIDGSLSLGKPPPPRIETRETRNWKLCW